MVAIICIWLLRHQFKVITIRFVIWARIFWKLLWQASPYCSSVRVHRCRPNRNWRMVWCDSETTAIHCSRVCSIRFHLFIISMKLTCSLWLCLWRLCVREYAQQISWNTDNLCTQSRGNGFFYAFRRRHTAHRAPLLLGQNAHAIQIESRKSVFVLHANLSNWAEKKFARFCHSHRNGPNAWKEKNGTLQRCGDLEPCELQQHQPSNVLLGTIVPSSLAAGKFLLALFGKMVFSHAGEHSPSGTIHGW